MSRDDGGLVQRDAQVVIYIVRYNGGMFRPKNLGTGLKYTTPILSVQL